ncbi:MAG: hypothetical protein CMM01_10730 [Rhodopirellula sp.]|nr:hypothetical protein [Rhodopirellula sp.]
MKPEQFPAYNCDESYQWNYDHPPALPEIAVPELSGGWKFCGHEVSSPLGISAGPLLNGRWCCYYARLGFDVLTYKTVRSQRRECYPMPNLQPVSCGQLDGTQNRVLPSKSMQGTWAVAFGMPSASPNIWRADIEWTRQQLSREKVLSVSVVGTMQEGWGIEELAADYAQCAKWAVESGADCIETNFSCPNVNTCDGQLYLDTKESAVVSEAVKSEIGNTPLIIKVGHFLDREAIPLFLSAVDKYTDAVSMTNSIANRVGVNDSNLMFESQPRGICGRAILEASLRQVRAFSQAIKERKSKIEVIGLGGIETAMEVTHYLSAGASACHLATHPMVDPGCGIKIRDHLAKHPLP